MSDPIGGSTCQDGLKSEPPVFGDDMAATAMVTQASPYGLSRRNDDRIVHSPVRQGCGWLSARCAPDPGVFQQECIDAFVASQVAQGFLQITIDHGTGVLERFLALADTPAWEITEQDVDGVIAAKG